MRTDGVNEAIRVCVHAWECDTKYMAWANPVSNVRGARPPCYIVQLDQVNNHILVRNERIIQTRDSTISLTTKRPHTQG